jgi:hypothetical protein
VRERTVVEIHDVLQQHGEVDGQVAHHGEHREPGADTRPLISST